MEIALSSHDLAKLKRELNRFDPTLVRGLRKAVREAGAEAVEAIRQEVRKPPLTDGGENVGARDALARATRMSLTFGSRSGGVRVMTGSVRNGFTRAYNSGTFRHPVFGRDVYVEQQGRPYFGKTINKTMRLELGRKVNDALDDAVRAIGGKQNL